MTLVSRYSKKVARLAKSPESTLTIAKLFFKATLFVFILILARNLDEMHFTDFQFISGLANMLSQPTYSLSMIIVYLGVSMRAQENDAHMAWLIKAGTATALGAALLVVMLFWALDPFLMNLADIQTRHAVTLGGTIIASSILFNVVIGFLLVRRRFFTVAGGYFLISFITLAGGYAIGRLSLGQLAAYGIQATALLATAAVILLASLHKLPAASRQAAQHVNWDSVKYLLKSSATMLAFFVMLNADILAVKILTDASDASRYLQQELVSRLFFVIASSIGTVLFVKTMHARRGQSDKQTQENRSFPYPPALILLACLGLIGLCAFMADPIVDLIFGRDIPIDPILITLLLSARFTQSVIFILLSAEGDRLCRRYTGVMGVSAALEIILLIVLARTPNAVACVALFSALTCFFMVSSIMRHKDRTLHNAV